MRTIVVSLAALAALHSGVALTQPGEVSYKATTVAPGLVMLEGVGGFTGGNLGLWSGADAVVLIDDGMPPYARLMRDAIEEHAGASVDFVINTHMHGDHVGNNPVMSEHGATIIAHDKLRARMLSDGVTGPDGDRPPGPHMLPEITFSEGVTLHLNGQRAHIIHVGRAHTDGDSIVHFPDADVIHTGDVVFNGLFPFIDLDAGGSVDGYLAAQERVLSLAGKDTKIIPGHGPLADKAAVAAARDMLVDARDRVRQLLGAGKNEDDILTLNPLADYDADWSWGFIDTERMTRALIRDGTD